MVNENYLFYAIMFNGGMKNSDTSREIKDMFEPLAKSVSDVRNSKVQF